MENLDTFSTELLFMKIFTLGFFLMWRSGWSYSEDGSREFITSPFNGYDLCTGGFGTRQRCHYCVWLVQTPGRHAKEMRFVGERREYFKYMCTIFPQIIVNLL